MYLCSYLFYLFVCLFVCLFVYSLFIKVDQIVCENVQ